MTFHKDVYLPNYVARLVETMPMCRFLYGPHSLRAAVDDRYGSVLPDLPVSCRFSEWEVIEVTLDEKEEVVKALIRRKIRDGRWLCLVVNPDGFVRTLWTNQPTDEHRTLNKRNYVQPPQQKSPPERAVCWVRPSETGHE